MSSQASGTAWKTKKSATRSRSRIPNPASIAQGVASAQHTSVWRQVVEAQGVPPATLRHGILQGSLGPPHDVRGVDPGGAEISRGVESGMEGGLGIGLAA